MTCHLSELSPLGSNVCLSFTSPPEAQFPQTSVFLEFNEHTKSIHKDQNYLQHCLIATTDCS